jgi:hypothetical protein
MKRAAFVRWLPLWLRAIVCRLLIGHAENFTLRDARVLLVCEVCEHESKGVDLNVARYRQSQPGDARRQRAARVEPEPVDPDWFGDEHFQGEHARVI